MPDDISDIAAYYSADPEKEHQRLENHQLEYDLTWRFLKEYLPPQGHLLEIGSATGRYTLDLAKRGYHITAVDLCPENIAFCRQLLSKAGLTNQVQLMVGDARYLNEVPEAYFDAVLLMGPLYHLVEKPDREMAVREAFERLRPGGVIFSAFISRYGIWGDLMKNMPEWIEEKREVKSYLTTGKAPHGTPRVGFRPYITLVPEIAPLHEGVGFETFKVVGIEPAISAEDESYNKLEGERRKLWLDLLYEISEEPSIVGSSRHLLYIGRKP
jgi:S-adenosylmethionine-dependent methyltransferase